MTKPNIVCVVPSIRPESMQEFRKAWAPLFERHSVRLITVWDGDDPVSECTSPLPWGVEKTTLKWSQQIGTDSEGLVFRKTDACRNLGFIHAANLTRPADSPNRVPARQFDYILTLDDDVHPPAGSDPIQEHLDVLARRVPISWMNTAVEGVSMETNHDRNALRPGRVDTINDPIYLRGFPYGIRDEAQVMVSHGVWVNVPDFDGKTQLELGKCLECVDGQCKLSTPFPSAEVGRMVTHAPCKKCNGTGYDGSRLPYSLPYFRGPVPKGCYLPFCGMNVMVRKEALPYLYFAPMGPDSGVSTECPKCDQGTIGRPTKDSGPGGQWLGRTCDDCDGVGKTAGLNRFADIWMGILLKRQCDAAGWAMYTGASTVVHTRASDPFKNVEQERLGIEWNEWAWGKRHEIDEIASDEFKRYWKSYLNKAARFRELILKLQGKS